ncbi:MAG: glycosyltransferase family 39 protein [Planctomycetota bacterium]|nr:glycosyltransferase family 39 protein [Planctomycetota bacterium]
MSCDPASSSVAVARFDRRQWMCLAAITVLAAALRLAGLGAWSFWVDEGHTWRDATMPLTGEGGFLATDRVRYGVPFLMLRLLLGLGLTGYDEASVRLPFALIGIATVPMMAVCGRRLVGAWPAVVAAGLLAINPWHIFWSQNARGYGLALLMCVIALHRAYRWRETRGALDLLLLAGAIGLAATSHPTAMMLMVAFVGFEVVRWGVARTSSFSKRAVGAAVFAIVSAVVLLPLMIRELDDAGLMPFRGFMRAKASPSLRHFLETTLFYFRPATLLAAALGMLVAPRVIGRDRSLYLACMAVVPLLVLSGVSASLVKVTARYGLCALPVLTWLVAALIMYLAAQLRGRSPWLAWLLPALLVADAVRMDVDYYTTQYGQRARWREAAEFVKREAERRGCEGVYAVTVNEPAMEYYLRPKHWFLMDHDPHPGYRVRVLLGLTIDGGTTTQGEKLHDPGAGAHLAWLREQCGPDALMPVMVTLPELREQDPSGEFEGLLKREFELGLHLPCWVGPKDESVYVYLPRR